MKVEIQCPCGKTYQVAKSALGKQATCKKCGQSFVVEETQVAELELLDDDLFAEQSFVPDPTPALAQHPVEQPLDPNLYSAPVPMPQQSIQQPISADLSQLENQSSGQPPNTWTQLAAPLPNRFQIEVHNRGNFDSQAVSDMRSEISSYLEYSPELFQSAVINIQLTPVGVGTTKPGVNLDASGTINGRLLQFSKSLTNDLDCGEDAFGKPLLRKETPRMTRDLIRNHSLHLIDKIAALVGQKKSQTGKIWDTIQYIALGVFIVSFAGCLLFTLFSIFTGQVPNVGIKFVALAVFSMAVFSAPIPILILSIGLVSMPNRFFLAEPAGRWALAMTGAKDVTQMRIYVVGGTLLLLFSGWMLVSAISGP